MEGKSGPPDIRLSSCGPTTTPPIQAQVSNYEPDLDSSSSGNGLNDEEPRTTSLDHKPDPQIEDTNLNENSRNNLNDGLAEVQEKREFYQTQELHVQFGLAFYRNTFFCSPIFNGSPR